MNAQPKTSDLHVNYSQRLPERLKAWADSLAELTASIAKTEALFPPRSESLSGPCFCAYHAP